MQRRHFTFCAALSLILCIATIALWVRSYGGSDSVTRRVLVAADAHYVEHHAHGIEITRGQLRFVARTDIGFSRGEMTVGSTKPVWSWYRMGVNHLAWDGPPTQTFWNRLGFAAWEYGWMSSFAEQHDRFWAVPMWLPCLLLAILPVAWLREVYRRRQLQRTGKCTACGYDLRASPGRCPECGTNKTPTINSA